MKESIRLRLEKMADRFEEVGRLLTSVEVAGNSTQFRDLSMEYARLQPLADRMRGYHSLERDLASAQEMLADPDASMRSLGAEELERVKGEIEASEADLRHLLLPKDPRDDKNIYLEVRAGTGGDEAAIFAGDLYRMYGRWAESKGYTVEILSENPGEHGGYKEIISRIAGKGVFSRLKFESGAHRVQRVPATEAQGRIHTSTTTVAVMPEAQEVDVEIKPDEIEINVCRASGKGGQGVNTTDSAVQIIHKPTGMIVRCADQRSQQKNKLQALNVLRSRLLDRKIAEENAKYAAHRKDQVGTGERSEKNRTYNFPQNRVTDHRIEVTLYNLANVIDGDPDGLIDPLMAHDMEERLARVQA